MITRHGNCSSSFARFPPDLALARHARQGSARRLCLRILRSRLAHAVGWEAAGEERVVTVALWERAVFVSSGDGPQVSFQVGVVGPDYVSIRMAESIEWVRIDQQSLHTDYPLMDSLHATLRHATPEQFGPQRWPITVDKLATEQRLTEALDRLAAPLDPLGPLWNALFAPDAWRQMVWDSWGNAFFLALSGRSLCHGNQDQRLRCPRLTLARSTRFRFLSQRVDLRDLSSERSKAAASGAS